MDTQAARPKRTLTQRSELWERLRAARHFADKTQEHIAKALGVSRAAVALHESRDANIRTRPSAEQVMAISKLTGVPAEFLMSDTVSPNDVWKYANRSATIDSHPVQVATVQAYNQSAQTAPPANATVPIPLMSAGPQDRLAKGFWAAVEFQVMSKRPELAECFYVDIDAGGGITLRADFLHGKNLVMFSQVPTCNLQQFATVAAGTVLLLERALHKPMTKLFLMWARVPTAPHPIGDAARQAFGIEQRIVSDVTEAAEMLLAL